MVPDSGIAAGKAKAGASAVDGETVRTEPKRVATVESSGEGTTERPGSAASAVEGVATPLIALGSG